MTEKCGTEKIIVFTICIILISIGFSGCTSEIDERGYEYTGIYSEVLLSPISEEDMLNVTMKFILKESLENIFPNVTIDDNNIYILFNENKYVAYNNFDYNKEHGWQYSIVDFKNNNSIMVISRVHRTYGYTGEISDSEEIAEKRSKDLIKEDKEFLKSKISLIIENIKSIYKTEIIYENYSPEFDI